MSRSKTGKGSSDPSLLTKLAAELLGTALLTFTIAAAAGQGAELAPVAIGSTLMAAIYAGGHISGAHFNPAVTLAIFIRGKISLIEGILYAAFQLCGGFLGGCVALTIEPAWGGGSGWWPRTPADIVIGYAHKGDGVTDTAALIAEIVLTFALCHTVLHVATNDDQTGNSYFGLAIGFTVVSGAVSVGGVSGGAFNPAVGMLSFVRLMYTAALSLGYKAEILTLIAEFTSESWISFIGPLIGGLIAGLLFRLTHPSQCGGGSAIFKAPRESLAPFIIEFVGTMLLGFTVATAAAPSNGSVLAPISIGSILMAQVYAGGSTSGAHYNPAVTVAVSLRRWMGGQQSLIVPPLVVLTYILVQSAGALTGGALALQVVGSIGYPAAGANTVGAVACVAEAVATFFLCLVVLQTATLKTSNTYFGLAIGFTVTAMAVTVGGISGGAFNPAVGLLGRLAVANPLAFDGTLWYYIVGPIVGGAAAAGAFRLLATGEFADANGFSMH